MMLSPPEATGSSCNSPEPASAKEVPRAGDVGPQELNMEPKRASSENAVIWVT